MKRHFCSECGQTVIDSELEEGIASKIDNSVYCYSCAQELEQKKEKEKEKALKAAAAERNDKGQKNEEAELDEDFLDEEEKEILKEGKNKEDKVADSNEDEEIEEPEDITVEDIDTEEPAADIDEPEEEEKEPEEDALVEVDLDKEETTEEELPPEATTEKKPAPASSSRRLQAARERGRGSGSSRKSRAAVSSRRAKAASGSSRLQAVQEEGSASERRRRISFGDRPADEKMKIVVLTISALFIIIGFLGLIVRGCGGSGGRTVIINKTEAKELVDEARKLKKEGISLYHKGSYDAALSKYYSAQAKYEQVLDQVRNKKLTPEEKAAGLSYEWIDDEYCDLGPLILSAREMKVRSDNRREMLNK